MLGKYFNFAIKYCCGIIIVSPEMEILREI